MFHGGASLEEMKVGNRAKMTAKNLRKNNYKLQVCIFM